jgi:hypothetical protein
MTDLFLREYEPHGNQPSKAPPRNPEIFPRNITGRTDGTWDPLVHGRKVFGPSTVWIGFLRMILLPSFPFPEGFRIGISSSFMENPTGTHLPGGKNPKDDP